MKIILAVSIALFSFSTAIAQTCTGPVKQISKAQEAMALDGGGAALFAKMRINVDGFGHAYHQNNTQGGGIIHLCNGGEVFLPDGSHYYGSESESICGGQFMRDYKRIKEAGWTDTSVGVIRWFGVLGKNAAEIGPRNRRNKVEGVVPVLQPDGSGFYVSPTALADGRIRETEKQERYVNAITVPAAVIKPTAELTALGVKLGTFGVAIHKDRRRAVPFIVGDYGPRIGEGSVALARLTSGLQAREITRAERYQGNVDQKDVLWVFFGGDALPPPYDAARVTTAAAEAFTRWGGSERLDRCLGARGIPR